jgi:hypothetical protein
MVPVGSAVVLEAASLFESAGQNSQAKARLTLEMMKTIVKNNYK